MDKEKSENSKKINRAIWRAERGYKNIKSPNYLNNDFFDMAVSTIKELAGKELRLINEQTKTV